MMKRLSLLCIGLSLFFVFTLGCAGSLDRRTIQENTIISDSPLVVVSINQKFDYKGNDCNRYWAPLATGENVLLKSDDYHFMIMSEYRGEPHGEPRGHTPKEYGMERAMDGPPKFVQRSVHVQFIKSKRALYSIDDSAADTIKKGVEELAGGLKFNYFILHVDKPPEKYRHPKIHDGFNGLMKTYWRDYIGDEITVVQIVYYESLLGSGLERKTWRNLDQLSSAQMSLLRLFEDHSLKAFKVSHTE